MFDIPQLARFMKRTTRFQALNQAHVDFDYYGVQVESLPPTETFDERTGLRISCRELGWQLSSLSQVFASFFPSIHMVQHLYIYGFRDFHYSGKTTSRTCNGIFTPIYGCEESLPIQEICIRWATLMAMGLRIVCTYLALLSMLSLFMTIVHLSPGLLVLHCLWDYLTQRPSRSAQLRIPFHVIHRYSYIQNKNCIVLLAKTAYRRR